MFEQSALHLSARLGYADMVELLINHGSRINFNEEGLRNFPVEVKDEPLRLALKVNFRFNTILIDANMTKFY